MSEQIETDDTLGDVLPCVRVADLKEGTRIDRYQILGLLGKGGMGAVYKAYDPELDRSIAIKVLTVVPHEGETASRPQTRLMREAQALAKLSHPNVVSVFDVGTYEEGVYIAMEYVKGKTLREWLKDNKPTQKEIIQTLSKAGEGLHAAHSEGIVHRDFKPDNVIIGDRGRIKVLDFGLARAAGAQDTAIIPRAVKPVEDSTSGEKLLSKPLTRVGAIVGTTVYMAPEHFLFQKLDEKTDQFSFSVTLFEALYGKRPFLGRTSEELEKNITSGCIEIPKEADVPKWIEDVVLKALSVTKTERFGDMTALLEALGNDPEIAKSQKRKKLFFVLAAFFGALLFIGMGYVLFSRSSELCTGAQKKLAAVWSEDRKRAIKQAFTKTGLAYADDTFVRVAKRIDSYLGEWKKQYTETCEATRLRGEQSEEMMDLMMGCINKHLRKVQALQEVFAKANNEVVVRAIQAVASLPSFSSCNDLESLQERMQVPPNHQAKKQVEIVRKKFLRLEALSNTGMIREAAAISEQALEMAKKMEYEPVLAEAMMWRGVMLDRIAQYQKAFDILKEAAVIADRVKHDRVRAISMVKLLWILGERLARFDEAMRLNHWIKGAVLRLDDQRFLESTWLNNLGNLYDNHGDYDKALVCYKETLKIREKIHGHDHPDVARSLNNLSVVYFNKGDHNRAIEYLSRAIAIKEKALGTSHPSMATSYNNIGGVLRSKGEYDPALHYYQKALDIFKKVLGQEHPHVAQVQCAVGLVFSSQGKYKKALEYYYNALRIWQEAWGLEHSLLVWPLSGIGNVLVAQGKPKDALEPLERAAAICKKKACHGEPHGHGLFGLAKALVSTTQDKERAIKLVEQARELFGKNPYLKKELQEVDAWLKKHGKR